MLNKVQILEGLRKAVELRGEDYVDPNSEERVSGCLYVNDRDTEPTPGCIVGTAYYVLTGELLGYEYEYTAASDPEFDDILDEEAKRVAAAAQKVQDEGGTWGQALREAESI